MSDIQTSVIIPHYNDVVRLRRCLDALLPQVAAQEGTVEVIVVDNGTEHDGPLLGAAHHPVTWVVEPQKGAAPVRNRGVAESRGPQLCFLDCDCVPAADWLATARRACGTGDVIGGQITVFDETPPPRSGAEAFETVFGFRNQYYIDKKGFSVTANLLTTRAVFDAVGGFRPGLSEDLDWCHRATAAGYSLIYDPALEVSHPTRVDWPALARKWHRTTREAWGLQPHGLAHRLRWVARACAMPLSAIAHMPRVLRSPKLRGYGEKWRAVGTLFRLRFARCGWMLVQAVSPAPRTPE